MDGINNWTDTKSKQKSSEFIEDQDAGLICYFLNSLVKCENYNFNVLRNKNLRF